MNNQKHTFGPWDITQHSWREISINSQSNQIAFIDLENCFDVDEDNQDDCESIALANANLVAAAPDLLDALIELSRYFLGKYIDDDRTDTEIAIDKANAEKMALLAIAKATGGSHE